MDAATETGKLISKAKVRKDIEGQEGVIKMKPAKDEIDRLVKLKGDAEEAADAYGAAVKFVAEQANLLASVVRKFVNARAGEKFEEERRKCEQLQLMFDELGDGVKK